MNNYLAFENILMGSSQNISFTCSTIDENSYDVEVVSPSKIYSCEKCELIFQSSKKLRLHYGKNKCSPTNLSITKDIN